jgi:flagellar motor switch protein FliM
MGVEPETLSQEEIDRLLASIDAGDDDAPPEPMEVISPAEYISSNPSPPSVTPLSALGGTDTLQRIDSKSDVRNYKLYNFRRPDKFSKDHLRALQTIHENFSRQFSMALTAYLRMNVEINVVSVDQLTYDEFVRSMPSPLTVLILGMDPLPGESLLGMTYEIVGCIIDRMLGGNGMSDRTVRNLTDIETLLIRRILDRAVLCLNEAWQTFVPGIDMSMMGMDESYSLIQVASPGEMVALITFEVNLTDKDSGLMSFCIPYPILESVLDKLSSQHIFHRQAATSSEQGEATEKILQKLQYAKTPVQVYMGGTQVKIKDLLELGEGDVIKMDRAVSEDMLIHINEKPKFLGRPGTVKNKLAVFITDAVENEENLEGFGLNE